MGIFDFFKKKGNAKTKKVFYDNGSIKEEFQVNEDGVNHGSCKLYHLNQELQAQVNWTNGIQDDGEVISYHDNGEKARQVILLNNKFTGNFFEWYSNGKNKKQGYYLDEKQIILKEWNENGELIEKDGNLNTKSSSNESDNQETKIYLSNGELSAEGNFKDGEKVQTKDVKLYHDNGKLKTQATLDAEGNPHGNCKEWYPSGNIFKDQNFKHGAPHGSMKEYFDNGNIRQEYNFKNGQHHGISNEFYEDGSKNMIVTFKDDKEHGMKEQYYPSGNLETRTTYVDGMIEGVHIYLKEDGEVIEEKIMQKGLDITMELMQLMMENNSEHLLKVGLIKAGAQEFEIGEFFQKIYEYYKKNNLRVDSAVVSELNQLLKEGKIDKDLYDLGISGLGQNLNIDIDNIKTKQVKVKQKASKEKELKKINSWEDVDFAMLIINGKYRIKILQDLYGEDHATYNMQQHLRRVIILGRDSEKSNDFSAYDDYIKNMFVPNNELREKEEKVLNEIYKETDLIKQNILIDNEIEKDPNLLELYNIKAYNLYKLEKITEGIQSIMKAIEINPQRAGFYDTAGEGYYMLEDYRKAVDIMSAGIEIAPEGIDSAGICSPIEDHYYNRGQAYLKLKEYDKAKADFMHILLIDITYEKSILALNDLKMI